MNKLIFGLILSNVLILFLLNDNNIIKDIKALRTTKIIEFVNEYTYYGLIKKMELYNYNYPLNKYLKDSVLLAIIICTLVYLSTNAVIYTLIVVLIAVLLLPYYHYLNAKRIYYQYLEESIICYVTSAIIFVRERKNSLRIIKDCSELVNDPLKSSLNECIETIEKTANYEQALDTLESKYQHQAIKKLHLLLKNYKKEGSYNENLFEYLYYNIEDLELSVNEYKAKKAANRQVFYYMVIINLSSVILIKKMFNSRMMDLNSPEFNFMVFVFFIANIITVLFYERYLSKVEVIC